jgi:hypothetical protein
MRKKEMTNDQDPKPNQWPNPNVSMTNVRGAALTPALGFGAWSLGH